MSFGSRANANDRAESAASDWLTPGKFSALLGLLIFAAYPDVILGQQTFFYRDFGVFGYPLAFHHRESFWRGELPLWNPLSACGLPFLAQWNSLTLYPFSLIYLLLPLPWSLGWFCLGHLFLAGLGMYCLARRWSGNDFAAGVAGVAFALNGLTLHSLMWPNNIAALGWMPWVVLTAERAWRKGGKALPVAALVGGTQMLAGAPEIILFTWTLVGTLFLADRITEWLGRSAPPNSADTTSSARDALAAPGQSGWRAARRFSTLVAWVASLAAAQLLPFLELLRHSQRDQNFATDQWPMPGWGWANFLVPLFHCTKSLQGVYSQDDQQWTSSYYAGVGALALAILGAWRAGEWRARWLTIVLILGAFLALGDHGGVYTLAKRVVPGIGFARYPIKFVVLVIFALPLLAAYGICRWETASESRARAARTLFAVGVMLCAFICIIVAWSVWRPAPREEWRVTLASGASRAIILTLFLAGLWLKRRALEPRHARWIGLALVGWVGVDALTHAPRQNPTIRPDALAPGLTHLDPRPRTGESRAMVSRAARAFFGYASSADPLTYYLGIRQALFSNCNLLDGAPKVDGFYSLYLREEAQTRALLYAATNGAPSGLADFLGISQESAPTNFMKWSPRPNWRPVTTAGQRPIFQPPGEILKALIAPSFDGRALVYLPPETRAAVGVTNASNARITDVSFGDQRLRFGVEAQEPSMVVIAQTFYTPWQASVDGHPVPLWRANYAFQALQVPGGHSTVELAYRDRWFMAGATISLTALTISFAAFVGRRPVRGTRTAAPEPPT